MPAWRHPAVNETRADAARTSNISGLSGGEIGRYPYEPGATGAWGVFDLYELVAYNTALSGAVQAALVANHGTWRSSTT